MSVVTILGTKASLGNQSVISTASVRFRTFELPSKHEPDIFSSEQTQSFFHLYFDSHPCTN